MDPSGGHQRVRHPLFVAPMGPGRRRRDLHRRCPAGEPARRGAGGFFHRAVGPTHRLVAGNADVRHGVCLGGPGGLRRAARDGCAGRPRLVGAVGPGRGGDLADSLPGRLPPRHPEPALAAHLADALARIPPRMDRGDDRHRAAARRVGDLRGRTHPQRRRGLRRLGGIRVPIGGDAVGDRCLGRPRPLSRAHAARDGRVGRRAGAVCAAAARRRPVDRPVGHLPAAGDLPAQPAVVALLRAAARGALPGDLRAAGLCRVRAGARCAEAGVARPGHGGGAGPDAALRRGVPARGGQPLFPRRLCQPVPHR